MHEQRASRRNGSRAHAWVPDKAVCLQKSNWACRIRRTMKGDRVEQIDDCTQKSHSSEGVWRRHV